MAMAPVRNLTILLSFVGLLKTNAATLKKMSFVGVCNSVTNRKRTDSVEDEFSGGSPWSN